MNTTLNKIVVHINENVDVAALDCLEQDIRQEHGVVSADHRPGQSHLIVVAYDSEVTQAACVLRNFREHGLHAQLLGM